MAIISPNKVKQLNLEETVLQLVYDVAEHRQITSVLADLGIMVRGSLPTQEALEQVPTEGLVYGDAYLVGEEDPQDLWIWTRPNPSIGHDTAYWLNIGPITVRGPAGEDGVSITNASINQKGFITFNLSNGSSFTLNNSVIGPEGKPGKDGGSPSVRAERTADGVTITTYSPSGDVVSQAKVSDGKNGQSIVGPAGPAGSFNLLGRISDASLLPPISSVSEGDAELVYNSNRDGYDIWVVAGGEWTNMGAPGAGTTIYVSGQIATDWDADTKLDKITLTAGYDRAYIVKKDGSQGRAYIGFPSTIPSTSNYIAERNSKGDIPVPLVPGGANMATSKQYVDNKVANAGGGLNVETYRDTTTYVDLPIDNHWQRASFIIVDLVGFDYDGYANHFTACFVPTQSQTQYIDSNRSSVRFWIDSYMENKIQAIFDDPDTTSSYQEWQMTVKAIFA